MVFIVFASDDVFSCKATGDDGSACVCELVHRHKAVTAARELEERKQQQRCFEGFCKYPKLESYYLQQSISIIYDCKLE